MLKIFYIFVKIFLLFYIKMVILNENGQIFI